MAKVKKLGKLESHTVNGCSSQEAVGRRGVLLQRSVLGKRRGIKTY